jgi:hypothetical protein
VPNHLKNHTNASEVLMALGALGIAQEEEERPSGKVDALAGEVPHALDNYRESLGAGISR